MTAYKTRGEKNIPTEILRNKSKETSNLNNNSYLVSPDAPFGISDAREKVSAETDGRLSFSRSATVSVSLEPWMVRKSVKEYYMAERLNLETAVSCEH
jgi:hypothetical protein